MASGGFRPTAPQNNYAVSATGGAGNGGQAPKYVAGMPYGEGADFMDLQSMAPMEEAGAPASNATMMGREENIAAGTTRPTIDLMAETEFPNEPVTDGIDMGPGRGSAALPPNFAARNTNQVVGNPMAIRYLPDLMAASRLPGAPDSYRRFVNYLSQQV